ncbi:Porin [Hyphomicrobium sp. 1Nfss2.1]|uniref:hypothetical protein n=1 Tax=Hyphomicrobium sp. 1Nfss2.1 TaxID=3413936 RepID=UPI003C7B014B
MMPRLCAIAAVGVVASRLLSVDAAAADLGGDCCADLEERIAELESTTARKGNRKVSLTVSGWVANQIMSYDNGVASNTYVTGVGSTLGTHVKFTGSAQVTNDVTAGYVMHIEMATSDPMTAGNTQFKANGPSALGIVASNGGLQYNQPELLYSYWFLKSNKLGQVDVGLIPQASEHAAVLVDASGSLIPANWVPVNGLAINLARNGQQKYLPNGVGFPIGAAMWCSSTALPIAGDCDAIPIDGIRYDTPTFHGFSGSASWGGDDFWDVAGRFSGEGHGFMLNATIAYSRNTDEQMFQGFNAVTGLPYTVKVDAGYLQMGAYLQHMATGLFLYGAYGKEYNDNVYITANQTDNQPSGNNWYLKAGLREKWVSLGHTVLYGEFGKRNDMFHPQLVDFGISGSELTQWGLGAVQEIDAAAMSLWVSYKNYDPSFSGPGVVAAEFDNLDDLDIFTAGALINF